MSKLSEETKRLEIKIKKSGDKLNILEERYNRLQEKHVELVRELEELEFKKPSKLKKKSRKLKIYISG